MDNAVTLQSLAQEYVDGVRSLYAGPATGAANMPSEATRSIERGTGGGLSYQELADRAEKLSPVSARVTEAASAQLGAQDASKRTDASTRLLAKVISDLEVSTLLLQAAQDEESGIGAAGETRGVARGMERSVQPSPPDEELNILLGVTPARIVSRSFGASSPTTIDQARVQLTTSVQDALALISVRASQAGQAALGGLLALGVGELAQAAGIVGMDMAQALGQADKVSRLFNLFRNFLTNAYNSLIALIGQGLAQTAANQVVNWVNTLKSGETFGNLLEKLYETKKTGSTLNQLVASSQAPLDKFTAAIDGLSSLGTAYGTQAGLVDKGLKVLKFVGGLPVAVIPQGRLILAAAYLVIGAYVIFAGADYVDAEHLKLLHRVPGVREVVTSDLSV